MFSRFYFFKLPFSSFLVFVHIHFTVIIVEYGEEAKVDVSVWFNILLFAQKTPNYFSFLCTRAKENFQDYLIIFQFHKEPNKFNFIIKTTMKFRPREVSFLVLSFDHSLELCVYVCCMRACAIFWDIFLCFSVFWIRKELVFLLFLYFVCLYFYFLGGRTD